MGALLHRWPTLPDLQKARPGTIRSFFTRHNCRDAERIEERIQKIRQAVPAITDPAVIQPAVTMTRNLVELIATLRAGIADLDQQIATSDGGAPGFRGIRFFPRGRPGSSAAAVGGLRLAAANAMPTAAEVQKLSGIAPVVKRSGKTESVHFRRACPKFLRQTFHEWAGHSIAFCDWARVSISSKRKRATTTMPPFEHWHSSGSALPIAAGRTAYLTTMPATSRISGVADHPSLPPWTVPEKIGHLPSQSRCQTILKIPLDRITQMTEKAGVGGSIPSLATCFQLLAGTPNGGLVPIGPKTLTQTSLGLVFRAFCFGVS